MYGRDQKADTKYVPGDYHERNFNTPLDPKRQAAFLAWAAATNRQRDVADYDLQGYFARQGATGDGHLTDKFKKPNHPTFSNESQYHGATNEFTGRPYVGGQWGANSYQPSSEMLGTTHDIRDLTRYFRRHEPGVELRMP